MLTDDLHTSELESSILYLIPDALIWVKPIFSADGSVTDFEVGYANKAAIDIVAHPKGNLAGLMVLADGVPSVAEAQNNYAHFRDVYLSGEVKEYTFFTNRGSRVVETLRHPHKGGVLSVTRDRGAQREAEQREKSVRRIMGSIVESSPIGVAVYEAIRDQRGAIEDFRIIVNNETRNKLLGLTEEEGTSFKFSRILKHFRSTASIESYVDVVENNTSLRLEEFVERSGKWIAISTVKLDDGFLSMSSDITEMKRSQNSLQQQSDYLNSILNASLDAVCTCEAVRDNDGTIIDLRYTQINDMYTKMIGLSAEQIIGKDMRELFPTAVDTGVFRTHCNVINSGISARFDIRYQGDGLDAWYDISSAKVGDNGVVITFTDVLEQKTAAKKIEEQKILLDKILSSSSNGISVTRFIRDEHNVAVDCIGILANDAAVLISGIPKADYLTKSALVLEPAMVESAYFKMCVQTLETGEPFITQYFFELTQRWLEISVSKMDQDHLIHIFTDVTSHKESQLQKDRLVEELKRSNNSLEQFAHAASHDMKEPLRKIRVFSERLKMTETMSESGVSLIDRVSVAAERMQLLVDDLLEFSHVSERPQEMGPIDLNENIKKVLADLELPLEETNGKVYCESLPVIRGNSRQIQQLFYNLISNSIKYSKADTPPEVFIRSMTVTGAEVQEAAGIPPERLQETFVLIEVKDNGIGFQQEYAEKIFAMFQRLHGRSEYSGSGIGLSIAQKVVENHDGYIWVSSELNIGSTFCIIFPK